MEGQFNVDGEWPYKQEAVQAYTMYCCQDVKGGLKDKPTKGPDPYHTMYSIAGCSIAQHKSDYQRLYGNGEDSRQFRAKFDGNYGNMVDKDEQTQDAMD